MFTNESKRAKRYFSTGNTQHSPSSTGRVVQDGIFFIYSTPLCLDREHKEERSRGITATMFEIVMGAPDTILALRIRIYNTSLSLRKIKKSLDLLLTRSWWYSNRHTSGPLPPLVRLLHTHKTFPGKYHVPSIFTEFSPPPLHSPATWRPFPSRRHISVLPLPLQQMTENCAVQHRHRLPLVGCCVLLRHTHSRRHARLCNNWLDVYNKSNQIWLGSFSLETHGHQEKEKGKKGRNLNTRSFLTAFL